MTDNREEKEKEEAIRMRGMMVTVRCTVRRDQLKRASRSTYQKIILDLSNPTIPDWPQNNDQTSALG